jgi:hypothetical protein
MSLKTIQLTIPKNKVLQDISSFSPEENFVMLKIGSDCLLEGRKVVSGLTQNEIYEKIKNEFKEEVTKLELNIIVEREMTKKMEERISKMYEIQLEQLKTKIDLQDKQLKSYECENSEIVQKEIDKVRSKFDTILQEKDKQNQLSRETFEKLSESVMKLTNKSNSHKGSEGEKQFCDYADTFMDFKGFQIVDKHTQGGAGDFHLHFDDFDILADAKNYKKKVPIDQREKIKSDLLKNEHIHFAWLVSLNTSIDKWDKSPIMYEWINTSQCIVYINNLSCFEDPRKILRIVWFTCKELYKLVEDVNVDMTELTTLREQKFKMHDKIKDIRKGIRELNTTMNTSKNIINSMDTQLKDMIETYTETVVVSNFSLFDEWWEEKLETTNEESSLLSTDIWLKFKQDNKNMIKEMDLSVDKFRQYIKSKVSGSNLIIKNKNVNSAFEIKGVSFKKELEVVSQPVKIEVKFMEESKQERKRVIKKCVSGPL